MLGGHTRCVTRRLCARVLRSQEQSRCISGEAAEVRIPAPYGHIAGKAWGDPGGRPIIGLHGWLDNAGTFDHLAPLINEGYYLVSLDQSGHGLTSKYPLGMQYKMSDGFMFLRRVLDHLQWEKTIILGHSMGGGLGTWYSAMFPEQIEKLIVIDLLSFGPMKVHKHVSAARRSVKEALKVHKILEKADPKVPTYSWDDAVARAFMAANILPNMYLGRDAENADMIHITQKSVETLMKRGLVEVSPGQYTWSADLRLRIPTAFNMTEDMTEEFAANVKCPHLVIKADKGPKYMTDEEYDALLKVFRRNNPNFIYKLVEGGHHVHLNDPEPVAKLVNEFLDTNFSQIDQADNHKPQFDL